MYEMFVSQQLQTWQQCGTWMLHATSLIYAQSVHKWV